MQSETILVCLVLFMILVITVFTISFCLYHYCDCLSNDGYEGVQTETSSTDSDKSNDLESGTHRQCNHEENEHMLWEKIKRNRKEASRYLNNRNLKHANRLFEINAKFILEQNSRSKLLNVDADLKNMIVSEALVILPKLLQQRNNNQDTAFVIDSGNENESTPKLQPKIRFWLTERKYSFIEHHNGIFEISSKRNSTQKKRV